MSAIIENKPQILYHILQVTPNYNQISLIYGSALHLAIKNKDFQTAVYLCKNTRSLASVQDKDGNLPLHLLFSTHTTENDIFYKLATNLTETTQNINH